MMGVITELYMIGHKSYHEARSCDLFVLNPSCVASSVPFIQSLSHTSRDSFLLDCCSIHLRIHLFHYKYIYNVTRRLSS